MALGLFFLMIYSSSVADAATTSQPTEAPCSFDSKLVASCPLYLTSSEETLWISSSINACSVPVDIGIKIKDQNDQMIWEHVFINSEESQIISGLRDAYVTIHLQFSQNETLHMLNVKASIKEDGDNLPTVFLQDTVALGHCSRHHFNSKFIAILAFAGICFLLFIATIVYMIYRRCQRKRKEPIPNMSGLYASQTEPLDNEINDPPTAQGTSSTTVIKNVIFKGNCTGGQAEESQLPMIHEESTDRDWWFAYENVSVLRDEVAPRSKRDKSNWRSKSKEGSRGRLGSDEASVPVIARSESMRSNSASNTSSWSYLPHSVI